ncbi:MAG: hypothetical protein IIZ78_15365 [Clostridiales bacterium]|nr:hypothetical protein [Clostridiales bacterium]
MIKYVVIAVLVFVAVLDVLLILGCAKLERMRNGNERLDKQRDGKADSEELRIKQIHAREDGEMD